MSRTCAVVTGHSRGLGEAVASHLLRRGIRVLGMSRRPNERLARTHRDLLSEVMLDLADQAALAAWVRSDALRELVAGSQSALLVNNAGIVQPVGPLQVQDLATVARAVALNVATPLVLSAAFASATEGIADRRILHISSGAGTTPYSGWSVYCATKAALDHHARATALDRIPSLRIGSVAPGVIDTDMQAEVRSTPEERFPDRRRFEELQRSGRLRSPEQAGGEMVDYLLSQSFGREVVMDLRRG